MADLGAIGKGLTGFDSIMPFPGYRAASVREIARQDGYISGVVTVNGVPVENCLVMCHWRPTGRCIARVWTDRTGAYRIDGLDPTVSSYYVVCQDPDGGTLFNDLIIAQATPAT